MATSGHFVTMLGVFSFYLMILDSKIEKKNIINLNSLIPRFNKRVIYYIGKITYLSICSKNLSLSIPSINSFKLFNSISGMNLSMFFI